MRDPRKKKLRDLRRKLKSCQRPHVWKLFALYHPEWSDRDPNTGKINWVKWCIPGFHEEARTQETLWKIRICGYEPYWVGAPPAHFRRSENRLHRVRQKAILYRAWKEGDWDDVLFLPERRTVRWDWW